MPKGMMLAPVVFLALTAAAVPEAPRSGVHSRTPVGDCKSFRYYQNSGGTVVCWDVDPFCIICPN